MFCTSEAGCSGFDQRAERGRILYELGTLLGWQPETLVWMLYGLFDESGEHKKDGRLIRLSIGGALATFDTWQAFTKDWIAILHNHHIETFHATEDKSNVALMEDVYHAVDKHKMWLFGTTDTGQRESNVFKEAYGKGVVDLLKTVHR
jgi:hypothetical protein